MGSVQGRKFEALVLGLSLVLGLVAASVIGGRALLEMRALERTVTVKGLAEREVPADLAIWPLRFNDVDNDLSALYRRLERSSEEVLAFLREGGFGEDELSVSAPAVTDRQAQGFYDPSGRAQRYTGSGVVTVYSSDVERVRNLRTAVGELGRKGIALSGDDYQARTEFLFTGLNALKPGMIEDATREAREVAQKFAEDSGSRLGKIRQASQGVFSISDRDSNTPHIKRVRVVSTLEYYLVD